MAKVDVRWHGDDYKRFLKEKCIANLHRACIVVQNEAKVLVSDPSPPPSSAGEPPHKDTGRLRASISREVDANKLVGRVGSNLEYAKYLELGTWKMAARPWLRVALDKMRGTINRIMGGK